MNVSVELIEEALLWAPSDLWEKAKHELDCLVTILADVPNPLDNHLTLPRKKAPKTSTEAAYKVYPQTGNQHWEALRYLSEIGPDTNGWFMHNTGMLHQSASGRFTWLKKQGFIELTGEKKKNPTGYNADVHRITALGQFALEHPGEARV